MKLYRLLFFLVGLRAEILGTEENNINPTSTSAIIVQTAEGDAKTTEADSSTLPIM